MTQRKFPTVAIIFLAAPLVLAFFSVIAMVIASMFLGGSIGTTLPTGRTVTASSKSIYLSGSSTRDSMIIETNGRKITVAPTALLVDGKKLVQIDEDSMQVDVNVRDETIILNADGKEIELQLR